MVHVHKATEIRQREIVFAAKRLIINQGAENMTVRRIANEVGISEAAIYRHFNSKKDILYLLLDNIEENLITELSENRNGETSLNVLDSILKDHLSGIEQRRGIRFQVIAEIISLGDSSLSHRAFEVIEKYIECIERLLLDGIKAGTIKKDIDVKGAATLLFSIVQGVTNVWALDNYSFDPLTRYEPMWRIVRQAIGND